jgi:two-component system sensor histidine kinase ResE
VLRNLLVNALRHTPSGGSVTVTVSSIVEAALLPTVEALEIAIANTGEGIGPDDLPHVFERFWRADPARARSRVGDEGRLACGTGLGLSVAQSLVEAQGGCIGSKARRARERSFGSRYRLHGMTIEQVRARSPVGTTNPYDEQRGQTLPSEEPALAHSLPRLSVINSSQA